MPVYIREENIVALSNFCNARIDRLDENSPIPLRCKRGRYKFARCNKTGAQGIISVVSPSKMQNSSLRRYRCITLLGCLYLVYWLNSIPYSGANLVDESIASLLNLIPHTVLYLSLKEDALKALFQFKAESKPLQLGLYSSTDPNLFSENGPHQDSTRPRLRKYDLALHGFPKPNICSCFYLESGLSIANSRVKRSYFC